MTRRPQRKLVAPEPTTVNDFPVRGTNFVMVTGEEETFSGDDDLHEVTFGEPDA